MAGPVLVPTSHGVEPQGLSRIAALDDPIRCRPDPGELAEMTNLRQIAFSIMVLTAFMLVLAAPFRW